MRSLRRRLAPALVVGALSLFIAATPASAITWGAPQRVTVERGSRLSALHELAAASGRLHLAHARLGPGSADDRVVYQRSTDGGSTWSPERPLFGSSRTDRSVVPNLAVASAGDLVAVAWRTRGPDGTDLWVRRSLDGGTTWLPRQRLFETTAQRGIGTPALTISGDTLIAAFTDRTDGRILLRRSADGGTTWGAERTLGATHLSIDCHEPVTDGLVGLASTGDTFHLAWSDAKAGSCIASSLLVRTSGDDGVSWRRVRTASTERTFGWPEAAARGRTLLLTLQRPDGVVVVVRSADTGATFAERLLKPTGDRGLGAADVLLPGGTTAWLVYADVGYDGNAVASSRVRFRASSDLGRTWIAGVDVVASTDKLRQVANLAAVDGRPIVVFGAGKADGSTSDIVASRGR